MSDRNVLGYQLGDEKVLMSVENGQFYAMTATSGAIWGRLAVPVRVGDLCKDLAAAYQAPLETVIADTLDFLSFLETQKLIRVVADRD